MEEGIATQYSILTWRILAWTEEPGGLQLKPLSIHALLDKKSLERTHR